MRASVIVVTVAMLLWGTFFIELGVFLGIGILLSLGVIYASVAKNFALDTIGILLLANVVYWIASGMAVGGLVPASFVNMKLYTGEGRIFISLIPLLALSFAAVHHWDFKTIVKQLYLIALASIGLYFIWLVTKTSLLSGAGHADEFHGFLSSHTGSGTFFGAFAVFFMIYTYERRSMWQFVVALLLLGPMFSSGSREALLGCMAAFAWYWGVKRKHPRIMVAIAIGMIAMIPIVSSMSNKTYSRTIGIVNWDTMEGIINQTKAGIRSDWQIGDWSPAEDTGNLESGDVTTLVRVMLWVYASKRFIDSPVFGMGWGRFNDQQMVMADVPGVGALGTGGNRIFSTGNAHNAYFQLASESGLIGLVLYLSLWLMLFMRCLQAEKVFKPFQTQRSYYVACQGLVIYILACALTGHALASPSVMVPVVTILGVGIAHYRTVIKRANAREVEVLLNA